MQSFLVGSGPDLPLVYVRNDPDLRTLHASHEPQRLGLRLLGLDISQNQFYYDSDHKSSKRIVCTDDIQLIFKHDFQQQWQISYVQVM